jgi:hypothetical protein
VVFGDVPAVPYAILVLVAAQRYSMVEQSQAQGAFVNSRPGDSLEPNRQRHR